MNMTKVNRVAEVYDTDDVLDATAGLMLDDVVERIDHFQAVAHEEAMGDAMAGDRWDAQE